MRPIVKEEYGLDKEVDHMYPFELSGGMARRVLIGTAVVEQPQLVIADEPTPGLHMEAALRVLSHFREIADQGAGVLLITHDLELALKTADKIVVFYAGTAVEEADTVDFNREAALRHPYTRALFRAMPEHGFAPEPGIQPYVRDLPEGCPYGPSAHFLGRRSRRDQLRELRFQRFQFPGQCIVFKILQLRGILVIIEPVVPFNNSAQLLHTLLGLFQFQTNHSPAG